MGSLGDEIWLKVVLLLDSIPNSRVL